jgi:putative peptide zinc metalloprotease protein
VWVAPQGRQMKLLTFFTVIVAMLLVPVSASAGGANHIVAVSTTGDNVTASRASVQAVPYGGDVATSGNLALATSADCTGCRTDAVAFQAVILTGQPNVASPENAAVAVNAACTGCDTFAFAYQYAVMVDGPASLTTSARNQVLAIQAQADEIAASGEPDSQMEADLKVLAGEFRADIDQGLVLHGQAATTAEQLDVQVGG